MDGPAANAVVRELETLRAERDTLKDENRILRGLIQTNPDWRCPHGFDVPTMGHCPSGFPGCACADDRIAVLCEDEDRIVRGLETEIIYSARKIVALEFQLGELFTTPKSESE